jgi:N-methylhydantoinase B
MRFTTAMRIHDLVLGALSQALPGKIPAGGGNVLVVSYVATAKPGGIGRVVVANPVPSGSAGGPDQDGVSGTDFSVAFLRNVPVEVLESEAPVLVRKYALRPDSEGPGRFRGGFGVEYELEIREPNAVVVMRGKDRHRFTAWGAGGGGAGTPCGCVSLRDGETRDIGKLTVYRPVLGEVIRLWSGGGGGYGDPLERAPDAVASDVAAGLVDPERAREVYGVVTGDAAATQALRQRMRLARGAPKAFDFGAARTEWERVHGEAPALIAAWLPSLPVGVRRYAQTLAYRRLHASGAGPYGVDDIRRVITSTEDGLGTAAQESVHDAGRVGGSRSQVPDDLRRRARQHDRVV